MNVEDMSSLGLSELLLKKKAQQQPPTMQRMSEGRLKVQDMVTAAAQAKAKCIVQTNDLRK